MTVDQVRRLKLKWAFGFEGDNIVFSQPSIIGNNVFVGIAYVLVASAEETSARRANYACSPAAPH